MIVHGAPRILPTPEDLNSVDIARRVRFWDFAASEGKGADWTVGVKMAHSEAWDLFFVEDVVRGRWSPFAADEVVLQTAQNDGLDVEICIEEEGGSSGKKVTAAIRDRLLVGYDVHAERPTGSKIARARAFAAACEAGSVVLVAGEWVEEFLAELERFPRGKHDDQVDAAAGAFNRLALGPPRAVWGPDPTNLLRRPLARRRARY